MQCACYRSGEDRCAATHTIHRATLADAWRHHPWQHPRHHEARAQGCAGVTSSRPAAGEALEGGDGSKHAGGGATDSRGGSGGGGGGDGGSAVNGTVLLRCACGRLAQQLEGPARVLQPAGHAQVARGGRHALHFALYRVLHILYSLRTLCNRYDSNWLSGSGRARRLGAGVITSRLTVAARAADSKAALGIWCAAVQARTGSQALPVRFSTRAFVLRTLRGSQETLIDVQNNTRDYAIQHRAGGEACGPGGPYRGNGVGGPGASHLAACADHLWGAPRTVSPGSLAVLARVIAAIRPHRSVRRSAGKRQAPNSSRQTLRSAPCRAESSRNAGSAWYAGRAARSGRRHERAGERAAGRPAFRAHSDQEQLRRHELQVRPLWASRGSTPAIRRRRPPPPRRLHPPPPAALPPSPLQQDLRVAAGRLLRRHHRHHRLQGLHCLPAGARRHGRAAVAQGWRRAATLLPVLVSWRLSVCRRRQLGVRGLQQRMPCVQPAAAPLAGGGVAAPRSAPARPHPPLPLCRPASPNPPQVHAAAQRHPGADGAPHVHPVLDAQQQYG